MIVTENILFYSNSLGDVLRAQLALVTKEVDSISKDQFLANSNEQIIDHVFSKMAITPLNLFRDQMCLSEPVEATAKRRDPFERGFYDAHVIRAVLSIPYSGESDLWKTRPSSFTTTFPHGDYSPQRGNDQAGIFRFTLEFTQAEYKSEAIQNEIDRNLEVIENYLGWIKRDIESNNPQLISEINQRVIQRRERLGTIQSVTKTLNIPIYPREGSPSLMPLPLQKKIIPPLASQSNQTQEYTIPNQEYENIINVIRHEGSSYERTPVTFAKHDEEELRDILLAHLNGHYYGQANGEAFRKKGKTDICIEFENRAAFVAECKLWKGEQKIAEAVNQLLGYLTWRDCKTSLIIFNKDVSGFKQIQEKLPEVLKQHPNFMREEKAQNPGEWRVVFRSLEDSERLVNVHVFLFNLFVAKEG
jgi:hypothetical protein